MSLDAAMGEESGHEGQPSHTSIYSFSILYDKRQNSKKEQQTIRYTMPPTSDSLGNLMGIEINRVLQGSVGSGVNPRGLALRRDALCSVV